MPQYHLDFLKFWHRTFALHLSYLVEGYETDTVLPDDVGDPHACMVGKWLRQHRANLVSQPAFAEVEIRHREFHLAAAALLEAHQARDQALVDLRLLALNAASDALGLAVDQLDTAENGPEAAVVMATAVLPHIWDDALLLGIPQIDAQHRELADYFDQCTLRGGNQRLTSEFGTDFLQRAMRLLTVHFDTEEMFMRRIGMPAEQIARHRRSHDYFLDRLTQYSLNPELMNKTVRETYGLFKELLIDHIVSDDTDLAQR